VIKKTERTEDNMAEKKYDVIVVGGGPEGIITAVTIRKYYPEKEILLIKSVGNGVIPCGIPYMFETLKDPGENALGNAPLEKAKVSIEVDEVVEVIRKEKKIKTKAGKELNYDKLVLAVGSSPIVPPVKGLDKKGVYAIHKDMDYLKSMKEKVAKAKNVLIIGGGFIGIEFADELSKVSGVKVSLAELLPQRDIFAVGDCAGKRDFFTRKNLPVMLASTATAAGKNL